MAMSQQFRTRVELPRSIARISRARNARPGETSGGTPQRGLLALQQLLGNRAVNTLLVNRTRADRSVAEGSGSTVGDTPLVSLPAEQRAMRPTARLSFAPNEPTVQRKTPAQASAHMTPSGDGEIDVGETMVRDLAVDPGTAARAKQVRWQLDVDPKRLNVKLGPTGVKTTVTIRGLQPGTEVLRIRLFVDDDPKGQPLEPVEFTIYPAGSLHGVGSIGTWGDSSFDTDVYQRLSDCNGKPGEGVHIKLRFKPGRSVDAETISLIQIVRAQRRGTPHLPDPREEDPGTARTIRDRSIPAGQAGAGAHIDPSGRGTQSSAAESTNPLYATDATEFAAETTLEQAGAVETRDLQYGEHGRRYRDEAGKLHAADAILEDRPCMADPGPNSGQIFETTALAVKGAQKGTYYGSVQWGWQTDSAGKYTMLPMTLVSEDAPSDTFNTAAALWNVTPTSKGESTIALPVVTARYTIDKTKLMKAPSFSAQSLAILAPYTQVEMADPENRDYSERFSGSWRQVTVMEGPSAGRIGWVLAGALMKG